MSLWLLALVMGMPTIAGISAMAQIEPETESQPKEKVVPVAVTDSDDQPGDQPSGLPAVVGMENITLSGTDLDYEIVGDKLILKGTEKDLDILEALISVVEESRETKEIRLVTLEQRGLIQRVPGQARSIRLLLTHEDLPDLE